MAPRLRAGAAALAGAALLAACDASKPPACFETNALSYGFALGGDTTLIFRWPAARMPVWFYAEPGSRMAANTLAGLTTWVSAFHCDEAWFRLVSDSTVADVIVREVVSLPPMPAAGVVLGADSVGACSGRTDGYFDSTRTLTGPLRAYVAPGAGTDSLSLAGCLRMATTHELGHALGLLLHSTSSADLMYPVPRRSTLSAADRYTVQTLYHTTPTIRPFTRGP